MIRKPWPIIFISLFFFLAPFFNVISTYYIIKTDFTFYDYFYSLIFNSSNYFALFNMIVPSLIAGTAVFCVKKWSYPVFLSCMAWITIQIFLTYSPHINSLHLFLLILFPLTVNILYVSYILLPKVRAPYFDSRLRWWETSPRYVFETDISINLEQSTASGKITNISEGGLFAITEKSMDPNSIARLNFSILETEIEVNAKIVYRKPDGFSHGFQFVNLTKAQKKTLANVIEKLARDKYEVVRPVPAWNDDMKKWFITLIKTGKGFVPEVTQTNGQPPTQKKD
jgi:hypothetical protein